MHRVITEAKPGIQIDHINRNSLDNRRSNLRLVTHRQNLLNQGLSKNNTSGFRGIYKPRKAWVAVICADGRHIYGGSYKVKEDAAVAYDMLALMFNGKFAQTNILKVVSNPKTK